MTHNSRIGRSDWRRSAHSKSPSLLEMFLQIVFPIFKPGTGYVSIFQLSPYFSQLSIKQLYLVLILKDEGRFGSQL